MTEFEEEMISKILITGPLHPSMPYIVLLELALEMGILVCIDRLKNDIQYYAKIFKKLSKLRPKMVTDLNTDKHLIQNFVNPLISWDLESLNIAYKFLILFKQPLNKIEELEINSKTEIGLQTTHSRLSLNACVLYALCKYHHIYVDIETSMDDMKSMLMVHHSSKTLIIVEDLEEERKEYVVEHTNPFSMYDSIENIESEANLFQDKQYILDLVQPKTHLQAIVLGALTLTNDYTKYVDPLREFNRHKFNIPTCKSDLQAIYIESKNPSYFDLNLYFNPYLPKSLYTDEMLESHLELFSYSSADFFGSPYYILQELHLHQNFHIGFHPNILNTELPVSLEPVSSLTNGDIVCFGVREEVLSATSWDELANVFQNTNQFTNIFEKNRLFSKNQIERLCKLGKWILKIKWFAGSETTLASINRCIEAIEEINLTLNNDSILIQSLVHQFKNFTSQKRNQIINGLNKLFELTMYMRGWDGKSTVYPVSESPYQNQDLVETKTLEAIFELDAYNDAADNFIYQLPLMIWKNEFVMSVLDEQGLNIGQRINIVKKGETEGVQSCIRMTSNVLGASYCYYCKIFKIPEKFQIKNLTYIQ